MIDYVKENKKRVKTLFAKYDPYVGINSCISRFKFVLDESSFVYLPRSMKNEEFIELCREYSSLREYCKVEKFDFDEAMGLIVALRLKHDFEYWCATCVKIQDKITKNIIPFVLRYPQRKLVGVLMQKIEKQEPIRIIVLKARQWGGSTVVQVFMAWIQLFHKKRWHSAIVADVEDQARNIKSMYSRLAQNHPKEIVDFQFDNFEGSTKNKVICNRECVVYIASMQNPDSLRSSDVMMAHLSEVGLWKQTEGKKPEDLIQSIAGTIPTVPYSMIVMESTAKGVGNYFHKQWQSAVNEESGYTPVFVAWYEIEIYFKPFKNKKAMEDFAVSLSDTEKEYFRLGATLEGINWYRNKMYMEGYDYWRMCCEFPTTDIEAFQSTGNRVHSASYIYSMRSQCKDPIYIGELCADKAFGIESIGDTLSFEPMPNGKLWLWALPEKNLDVRRRYVVSMDIGGRCDSADWTVISVVDRYWLLFGGVEECVATYRFHLDQDLAVWKAVQTARFFNDALLVVEANSLNPKGVEGDHTLTILDEIKNFYPNLYSRTDPQKIIEGYPEKYGFFTSVASKTDLVNQMNKRYRENGYIERDRRALDEADMYEMKENGSFGAVEGAHDDIYMSRAIGLKASQIMEFPRLVVSSKSSN